MRSSSRLAMSVPVGEASSQYCILYQLSGTPDRQANRCQSRQALHAAELGFRHPITDEPLSFEMPMPADMTKLLAKLRAKR